MSQMVTKLNSKAKILRRLDRSIECEMAFANEKAEPMLQQQLADAVLQAFPTKDTDVSIKEAPPL
eukprot:2059244-Alexandrium_andersonii.AAC.1